LRRGRPGGAVARDRIAVAVDLNISLDVAGFASKFAAACELLGNNPEPPRVRRPLRVIDHD
jgi:hypothetical protein